MSTVYQRRACFSGLWLHVSEHSPVSTGDIFWFTGNMKNRQNWLQKAISDITNGINMSAWMALISLGNL